MRAHLSTLVLIALPFTAGVIACSDSSVVTDGESESETSEGTVGDGDGDPVGDGDGDGDPAGDGDGDPAGDGDGDIGDGDGDIGDGDGDPGDGDGDIGDGDGDPGDGDGDPGVQACEDGDLPPAPGVDGPYTQLRVAPFLQLNAADSVWVVWELEADAAPTPTLEWGCTDALPNELMPACRVGKPGTWICEVQISELEPNTEYWYRVKLGEDSYTTPENFHTLHLQSAEAPQRFVVMSDMQPAGPSQVLDTWIALASEGVAGYLGSLGLQVADLAGLLIPGDLVSNGNNYDQWAGAFFRGAEALAGNTAVWPVPGNHEYQGSDTHFFNYFMLPENGSEMDPEHWYFRDFGNIRVLGLDSNGPWRTQAQLDWLQATLVEACADDDLDFVFAQLHHPHRSELWLPGETNWSGLVVEELENFTLSCGKPSIHFFGHTHAYNRGASRDAEHVWMNVATASGNIDYFGEFPNADYTELNVAYDEYGFVLVETEAGEDPSFHLRRISRGDEFNPLDNVVRDELTIHRYNQAPDVPVLPEEVTGINPECPQLPRGVYADPEGDAFAANRVQVAVDCQNFDAPLADVWWQASNIWDDEDTNAELDPTRPLVTTLLEGDTQYCYRVKVRDSNLGWSDWSQARSFTTGAAAGGPNLLVNGDAEAGINAWSGDIESIASGDCNAGQAHAGGSFFAVGGVCANESPFGQAEQVIELGALAAAIDLGDVSFELRGYLRDFGGNDLPSMHFELLDAGDIVLATSASVEHQAADWSLRQVALAAPVGTRRARVVLEGTRNAGADNDSYFDDLLFRELDEQLELCPEVKTLLSAQ